MRLCVSNVCAGDSEVSRRKIVVRRSQVHGRGVFAARDLLAEEKIIEYKGERISWKKAIKRHPHDPDHPHHTFYFALEDGRVIDGKFNGNSARWINHSCQPNCEAREEEGSVYIYSLSNIQAGEELFYDYALVIDARHTAKLKREYECHCKTQECRKTMLAPKSKKR